MIHYHGTPITPERDASVILMGRHAFVPFLNPDTLGTVVEVCQSFAVDNSAFTFWRNGKDYDFNGYREFVVSLMNLPMFDWCVIPDVIDGSSAENDRLISEWTLPKSISVPVWHLHESIERLESLADNFPRVALGSSGQYSSPGTSDWWSRIGVALKSICNSDGQPRVKLHGMRMLNPEVFRHMPLASADSTNVAQNMGLSWGGRYEPRVKSAKGVIIADRIEAVQSPQSWRNYEPSFLFGMDA
tara:strand:+ start:366 stop:1097 length:732 start_codon:yes stop_codon:yes gene_type:complete